METSTCETRVELATNEQALALAIQLLHQGQVVAFPTDTVYGVGCDLWQTAAIDRLYRVKARPRTMAIPVLVSNLAAVSKVAIELNASFLALAQHFWPGELTLIAQRSPDVPDMLCAGGATIALRMPNHPLALSLCTHLGGGLAATSANISGSQAGCSADIVLQELHGRIPLILDSGVCTGGIASTIIDCVAVPPVLLRLGKITLAQLQSLVPDIIEKR